MQEGSDAALVASALRIAAVKAWSAPGALALAAEEIERRLAERASRGREHADEPGRIAGTVTPADHVAEIPTAKAEVDGSHPSPSTNLDERRAAFRAADLDAFVRGLSPSPQERAAYALIDALEAELKAAGKATSDALIKLASWETRAKVAEREVDELRRELNNLPVGGSALQQLGEYLTTWLNEDAWAGASPLLEAARIDIARASAAERKYEACKQQAQIWAQEARTYRSACDSIGWNISTDARPPALEAAEREVAQLTEERDSDAWHQGWKVAVRERDELGKALAKVTDELVEAERELGGARAAVRSWAEWAATSRCIYCDYCSEHMMAQQAGENR